MENCFNVLKIKKIKNKSQLITRANHDFRKIPNAAPNADYSMSFKNEVLYSDKPDDYLEAWENRILLIKSKGKNITVRKNAVLAFDVMIGFSHEATKEIDVEIWKEKALEWLNETFGEINVLQAVLHFDESTPHIHAMIIPIDEREKLCAKRCLSKRNEYYALHDSLYEKMKDLGLERGIKYSKPTSYTIKKFYSEASNIEEPPKITPKDDIGEFNRNNKDFYETSIISEKKQTQKWRNEARIAKAKLHEFKVDYSAPIDMFNIMRQLFGDKLAEKKVYKIIELLENNNDDFKELLDLEEIVNTEDIKDREKVECKKQVTLEN